MTQLLAQALCREVHEREGRQGIADIREKCPWRIAVEHAQGIQHALANRAGTPREVSRASPS